MNDNDRLNWIISNKVILNRSDENREYWVSFNDQLGTYYTHGKKNPRDAIDMAMKMMDAEEKDADGGLLEHTQEALQAQHVLMKKADDEILRLRGSLTEIREVYAAMKGFEATSQAQVYYQRMTSKMNDIAVGSMT